MMLKAFKILVGLNTVLCANCCFSQQLPVTWNWSVATINNTEAVLYFTATLQEGWHIYSQSAALDGPMPTRFQFNTGEYTLIGETKEEGGFFKRFDPIIMRPNFWLEKTVVFSQRIKVRGTLSSIIGRIFYMPCSAFECLPPQEIPFQVHLCPATEASGVAELSADKKNEPLKAGRT